MFTSTLNSSWDERSRRGLTTLTSFGVQVLVGRRVAGFAAAPPDGIAFDAPTLDAGQSWSTSRRGLRRQNAREWKHRPEQSRGHHSDDAYTNSESHTCCER